MRGGRAVRPGASPYRLERVPIRRDVNGSLGPVVPQPRVARRAPGGQRAERDRCPGDFRPVHVDRVQVSVARAPRPAPRSTPGGPAGNGRRATRPGRLVGNVDAGLLLVPLGALCATLLLVNRTLEIHFERRSIALAGCLFVAGASVVVISKQFYTQSARMVVVAWRRASERCVWQRAEQLEPRSGGRPGGVAARQEESALAQGPGAGVSGDRGAAADRTRLLSTSRGEQLEERALAARQRTVGEVCLAGLADE